MAAPTYALTDRYLRDDGRVFLTGVQTLAESPVEQLRADRRNGLNTAAFISGYPGSPLGGFDQEVARAALDDALPIVCEPGVNEELGATAVMGSQLAATQPDFRYDGVLGTGRHRASIAPAMHCDTRPSLARPAMAGPSPSSAMIRPRKSSTLPSSSDATIYDLHAALLPGDVETIVARHAASSR